MGKWIAKLFKSVILNALDAAVSTVTANLKAEIDASDKKAGEKDTIKAGIDLVESRLREEVGKVL